MKITSGAIIHSLKMCIALGACSCLQAQNSVQKVLVGATKTTVLSKYEGSQPLTRPVRTLLYGFEVPPDAITLDRSVAAHILSHDPIARMKHDEGGDESRADVAAHVQKVFSETLVRELNKTAIPAEYAATDAKQPEMDVLAVHGDFTTVNLGNKTKRMLIGFGRGASDVKAHVCVSLILHGKPLSVMEFNITSESGKKPGAVATMGVGSAAASVAVSGATDGKASVEADAARMAKAVAKQIEDMLVAQRWTAAATEAR
jgi:hypothetical protein